MKVKNSKHEIVTRSILRSELDRELKPIKQELSKISRNLNLFIKFFDKEQVKLKKRVDRVDTHLGLPPI